MSNFLNPSVVAAEVLDQLEHELVAAQLMYRDMTSDFGPVRGLKVGDRVSVRTVPAYRTDEFTGTIDTQEVNQSSTQIEIEKHFDTSVEITARERALNLDGIRKEIATPVAVSMAQKIDEYLLTKVVEAQGMYSSSVLGETAADLALARRNANRQQISKANRIALVNDDLEATLLSQDIFHKFDTRGEPAVRALREADMGRLMGFDWYSTVNFPEVTRTAGAGAGVTDNGGGANNVQGMSVITTTATTGTLEAGDKLLIAGALRSYTVAAQVAAGATAIPIEEQISEIIPDGAAISVRGSGLATTYQGIVFNPGAFAFAAPPLDPAAGDIASATQTSNGFSIRVTEGYDIQTKQTVWSFDMLLGAKATDARLAMLLAKTP